MSEGVQNLAIARLEEEREASAQRLVDLRIQWLEDGDSNTVILDAGGRWDRKLERWVDDGEQCRIVRLHEGQYEAGYWFARWLRHYVSGEPRPRDLEHVWTLMLAGGRRGGKSDLAEKIAVTTAAAKPRGIVWGVSPHEPETEELQVALADWISAPWAHYSESKLQWRFAHGSVLTLRSAHNPASLKRGRVDLVVLNEAQNMASRAYAMVRAPIADRGGLVVAACNPPDKPIGRWVMDLHEAAQAGRPTVKLFEFDPERNPYVDPVALRDMRHDVGELDYRREVLGEFIEIGDLVWYAWSPRLGANVRPEPELGRDVTRAFTRRHLGREFDYVFGIDLQLTPHMAAAVIEFYADPDPAYGADDPLMWVTDEIVLEGNEDDLIDAIEDRLDELDGRLYKPERCALILDASAWWQDAERTKGRGSADMFRRRGWRNLYRPDRKALKNPLITERVAATNARMRSAAGRRALFSVPGNREINTALKRWENRNGIPHRTSPYAHCSDAVSYPVWRFFPRKLKAKPDESTVGYERVERRRSRRERDLDNLP